MRQHSVRRRIVALAIAGIVFVSSVPIEVKAWEVSLLKIELLVFRGLDERQIVALKREVAAIWEAQSVTIDWSSEGAGERVRVIVDRPASSLPETGRDERWSVASTRVVAGRMAPPIYVSLDAAERVVRGASPPFSSPALAGIMVPRVAARAIAHELAHFLLNTREHSRRGLLRARFKADDFVTPARDGLGLDREQMARAHRHDVLLPVPGSPP